MAHLGKVVCKACWKKETANKGGICTGCLNHGLSARPRPIRELRPDEPDTEPVYLYDDENDRGILDDLGDDEEGE